MEHHEVAVVGGGPAGSVCAAELAKSGVDVALFDHSHPREKPCGGAVSTTHLKEFNLPKKIIEREINCIILEDHHGHKVRLLEKAGGIVLMREKLDCYLFRKAKKDGAKLIDERVLDLTQDKEGWIVKTNENKYHAKFLVGADGCPSLVRRKVLSPIPSKHLSHTIGYHIPHKRDHINEKFGDAIELYLLGEPYVKKGYIWIFPKLDFVTVGLGTEVGTPQIKKSLDDFIKNHPATKRIILPKEIVPHSHLLPFVSSPSFYDLPTTGKNWVLIGDAAGHVNAITGEGIYYAMKGGKLAAKAYLEGNSRLFERYWRKDFGGDMYYAARFQKFFYNPIILDMAMAVGVKSATMNNVLADLIATRIKYNKLFFKVFFDLPLIIKDCIKFF